jgi:hypothetical protein
MVSKMLATHWIDGLVSVMRTMAPCIVKDFFAGFDRGLCHTYDVAALCREQERREKRKRRRVLERSIYEVQEKQLAVLPKGYNQSVGWKRRLVMKGGSVVVR